MNITYVVIQSGLAALLGFRINQTFTKNKIRNYHQIQKKKSYEVEKCSHWNASGYANNIQITIVTCDDYDEINESSISVGDNV